MTIIFIPGNNTSKSLHLIQKSHWEELLKKEFPDFEIKILFSPYDMWDQEKVNSTIDKIVQEIKNTQDQIILFGYSFGGFITRLVYQRLPEAGRKKVKAIVTMGTPHRIPNNKQRKFVEGTLGLKRSIDIPMLVLTGYFDQAAIPYFARLHGANMKTKSFWCTHSDFFYSRNTRDKVIKEMKKFFREYSLLKN